MAINRRSVSSSPAAVWAALMDGYRYGDWVVGTSGIRKVDDGFPAVGSRIHYTVGRGPVRHEGHTEVLALERGRRLELEAVAWPLGTVMITLTLDATDDGGCTITIDERPAKGLGKVLHNPLTDRAVKLRNVETLRRLERLARRSDQPA
jgi:uncharacterized protein YndB with AHSA1/START domain